MKSSKKNRVHYQQLQTIRKVAIVRSTGIRFVNGVSNKYDATFPENIAQIAPKITKQKYQDYMNTLNRKVGQYWPCAFAYYCGYLCVPLTLGLSLFIPKICINEAQDVLRRQIKRINKDLLSELKLEMRLQKDCCDSRLVIEEIDFTKFEVGQQI